MCVWGCANVEYKQICIVKTYPCHNACPVPPAVPALNSCFPRRGEVTDPGIFAWVHGLTCTNSIQMPWMKSRLGHDPLIIAFCWVYSTRWLHYSQQFSISVCQGDQM